MGDPPCRSLPLTTGRSSPKASRLASISSTIAALTSPSYLASLGSSARWSSMRGISSPKDGSLLCGGIHDADRLGPFDLLDRELEAASGAGMQERGSSLPGVIGQDELLAFEALEEGAGGTVPHSKGLEDLGNQVGFHHSPLQSAQVSPVSVNRD